MDGVVLDSYQVYVDCLYEALKEIKGREYADEYKTNLPGFFHNSMWTVADSRKDMGNYEVLLEFNRLLRKRFYEEAGLMEGAQAALQFFKKQEHCIQCIASNNPQDKLDAIVKHRGIGNYFEKELIIGRRKFPYDHWFAPFGKEEWLIDPKPSPGMIYEIMGIIQGKIGHQYRAQDLTYIMVDDGRTAVEMGEKIRNHGFNFYNIVFGIGGEEELKAAHIQDTGSDKTIYAQTHEEVMAFYGKICTQKNASMRR
ncbi:MAG: HAD family hydrolase [Rickettsiales bacterium]|nr:HAD family hydrolase [Rickettsiales bacterium]